MRSMTRFFMSRSRLKIFTIALLSILLVLYQVKVSFDGVNRTNKQIRRSVSGKERVSRYLVTGTPVHANKTIAHIPRNNTAIGGRNQGNKTIAHIPRNNTAIGGRNQGKAANTIGQSHKSTTYNVWKKSGDNNTATNKQTIKTEHLHNCIWNTSKFHGREPVNLTYHMWNHLESTFNDTLPGGRWKPTGCRAPFRIAIIIPYRDRDSNLKIFMSNVLPKLQRQQLDYTIFVVEQAPGSRFNRGMLRNIGFLEANKKNQYDCYIFNDADTLIEDDRNIFTCDFAEEKNIRHIAVLVDAFNYTLLYPYLIGGILGVTYKQFVAVNGYSNAYFVWGAEDDDLFRRFHDKGFRVVRPPNQVSHTTTLNHERDPMLDERKLVYKSVKYISGKEGLNTVRDKYEMVIHEERKLFTWLYVRVNEELVLKSLDEIKKKYYIPPKKAVRSPRRPSLKAVLQTDAERRKRLLKHEHKTVHRPVHSNKH